MMDQDFFRRLTSGSAEEDWVELSAYLDGEFDEEDQELIRLRLVSDGDYAALAQVLLATRRSIQKGALQSFQSAGSAPITFSTFKALYPGLTGKTATLPSAVIPKVWAAC